MTSPLSMENTKKPGGPLTSLQLGSAIVSSLQGVLRGEHNVGEDPCETTVHTGARAKDCGVEQSLKVPETTSSKLTTRLMLEAENARCKTTCLVVSSWASCHGAGMLGLLFLAGNLRRGFHEF